MNEQNPKQSANSLPGGKSIYDWTLRETMNFCNSQSACIRCPLHMNKYDCVLDPPPDDWKLAIVSKAKAASAAI